MTDNFIRVRLHFDYAPPAVVGCRMCWLLVDLRSCRVVADLEGIIRDKFELSPGSILSLFIEDCYLPHTESVLVVRDNDCVRVKVDSISNTPKQTSTEAACENKRKRQRPVEEEESLENGPTLEFKKKKRKRSVVDSAVVSHLQTETEETHASTCKKKKDKKKQNEERQKSTPTPVKASPSVKKSVKSAPKIPIHKPQSSSSTSSSSEDEQPAKKVLPPKPVPKLAPVSALAAPKTIPNGRPPSKKLPPPASSSSSGTDSSSEEDKTAKAKSTNDKSKSEERTQSPSSAIPNGANHSEDEIELVIKRPVQHPHGRIVVGRAGQLEAGQQAVKERGLGKPEPKESRGKGRGRGNCVQYNYHEKEWDMKASYSTDSLTNVSVVLQNVTSVPKPDYSCMPLLAAPPQVGQKIAFKLLELTENYTPEVSDYKEAKILNFDPNTKQIELELLTSSQAPSEPGKFDLVYQNADGSESVEYAVDRGSLVMERWDSLLEPRLVI